jgi:hypothetical protein
MTLHQQGVIHRKPLFRYDVACLMAGHADADRGSELMPIHTVVDFLRDDDWLPIEAVRRRGAWGVLLLTTALFALATVASVIR